MDGEALGLPPVVAEAKKRFDRCSEWFGTANDRFLDDLKFAHGDSDNGYQWPNAIRATRDVDNKPSLTINIIRQHNLQISNEARKNKSSIKVRAQGGGASENSAQVMGNLIRRVELQSQAQSIYTQARNFQVDGGIGYWRLATRYVSNDSFDQECYILPVSDPIAVFLDPDIKMKDGSDAKFCLIFDDVPKDQFKEAYPEFYSSVGPSPLGSGTMASDWITKDHIRVAEYFRKVAVADTLYSFVQAGERKYLAASMMPPEIEKAVSSNPLTKTRLIQVERVEWYLIAGEKVIDRTIWPGKHIPVIRCVGEESVIEGIYDRKGHTRAMKDAQRIYNYNASAQVEFVALQGKTPWVATAQAIEEYEGMWNTANTVNHSILIYNGVNDAGDKIDPPQRTAPPVASAAYQAGMDTAFNQMMMASGQWQNQMGMMGNERTGKAIGLRQAQSATATFHFQDNYEEALQFTGRQLIDLFGKVYDTKRVIQLMDEDGSVSELQIDPSAKDALQLKMAATAQGVDRIFNPAVGQYDVAPAVGPSYGSRKEETNEALTLILTQAPQLIPIIGDLLLGSMDFEKAQEAAQRLKRMVPGEALGTGPSQKEGELLQAVDSLKRSLSESLVSGAKTELKLVGKSQQRDIDVFKAETDRIGQMKELLPLDPEGLKTLVQQLVQESLGTPISDIHEANSDDLDVDEMPLDAVRAGDGNHYRPHPTQLGAFMQVMAPAGEKNG